MAYVSKVQYKSKQLIWWDVPTPNVVCKKVKKNGVYIKTCLQKLEAKTSKATCTKIHANITSMCPTYFKSFIFNFAHVVYIYLNHTNNLFKKKQTCASQQSYNNCPTFSITSTLKSHLLNLVIF